ncbi:hypothetical protein PHMEG_00033259 [Phytophthora megakarya]|uniref:Uncharacterized protein n=1 Tax=Phytophthora megakarya TaxID=4795 RepID=A0A225UTD0_9STRA|nr:hypothetical protein PHMEG_00033259 [Phytophthora megakarya]
MFEEVEDLPNTVAVKFGAIYHPKGGNSVPLGAVLVIHRFVEPGRTVLVWRCFIQGGNDFAGTFLHSINWCVLRRTTSDYTDVGMCIHLIPMHQNQNERSDGLEFSSIVLRSSNQDKLELTRLMQKLLLD